LAQAVKLSRVPGGPTAVWAVQPRVGWTRLRERIFLRDVSTCSVMTAAMSEPLPLVSAGISQGPLRDCALSLYVACQDAGARLQRQLEGERPYLERFVAEALSDPSPPSTQQVPLPRLEEVLPCGAVPWEASEYDLDRFQRKLQAVLEAAGAQVSAAAAVAVGATTAAAVGNEEGQGTSAAGSPAAMAEAAPAALSGPAAAAAESKTSELRLRTSPGSSPTACVAATTAAHTANGVAAATAAAAAAAVANLSAAVGHTREVVQALPRVRGKNIQEMRKKFEQLPPAEPKLASGLTSRGSPPAGSKAIGKVEGSVSIAAAAEDRPPLLSSSPPRVPVPPATPAAPLPELGTPEEGRGGDAITTATSADLAALSVAHGPGCATAVERSPSAASPVAVAVEATGAVAAVAAATQPVPPAQGAGVAMASGLPVDGMEAPPKSQRKRGSVLPAAAPVEAKPRQPQQQAKECQATEEKHKAPPLSSTSISPNKPRRPPTPGTGRSVLEPHQVLRQMVQVHPKRKEDNYEMSDFEGSDVDIEVSEMKRSKKHVPSWCFKVAEALDAQADLDPDSIFGSRVARCLKEEIFPRDVYKKAKRERPHRKRGTSVDWRKDPLTKAEVNIYKSKMGQLKAFSADARPLIPTDPRTCERSNGG